MIAVMGADYLDVIEMKLVVAVRASRGGSCDVEPLTAT
jgi:hypothetical protein